MVDDRELLRRYARERSEDAFSELVRRHINLVFHAALRRTSNPQLAKDATQLVFIALARKAAALSRHAVLTGWLYTATRYEANTLIREERRRQFHEQKAEAMTPSSFSSSPDWNRIRPTIDRVMDQLPGSDRAAVLLRYFEGRSFVEIGAELQLTEEAARKRVTRSVVRMRGLLARRGIESTAAALEIALSSQAGLAAPSGLAAAVMPSALAAGLAAVSPWAAVAAKWAASVKSISLAGILGTTAVLGLPLAGAAVYEVMANRQAQAQLLAVTQKFDFASSRLQFLEGKLVNQATASAPAVAVREPGRGRSADPLVEGRKFLRRFPQVRALLFRQNETGARDTYAPLRRMLNLSPAQYNQLIDLTASSWIDGLGETPQGLGLGPDTCPSPGQLRDILGAEGAAAVQNFKRFPFDAVNYLAVSASLANAPLTEQQDDQLARVIADNTGPRQVLPATIGPVNFRSGTDAVDWDKFLAQAKSELPPDAFQAIQGPVMEFQFEAAIDRASEQ